MCRPLLTFAHLRRLSLPDHMQACYRCTVFQVQQMEVITWLQTKVFLAKAHLQAQNVPSLESLPETDRNILRRKFMSQNAANSLW